jgi:hypothetical protein
MVSASFVAQCMLSDIFIINIQERINKIMEEEEECIPHQCADLKI